MVVFLCFNGQFANPKVDGLGETFTRRAEGGAIAHISAAAKSFIHQNNLMSERLYDQFFAQENLAFGPALNAAFDQYNKQLENLEMHARNREQRFASAADTLDTAFTALREGWPVADLVLRNLFK